MLPEYISFPHDKGEQNMILTDNRITHLDLINVGIIILDKKEEDAYLERINDEFAFKVGSKVLNRINNGATNAGIINLDEISEYVKANKDEFEKIVGDVKAHIVNKLKSCRRNTLKLRSKASGKL